MAAYVGIFIISAATLLLELTLLRLFAVQQFYHFAFMAISLALLGAGASGSVLSLRRRHPSSPGVCLAFGLTTLGAYLIINFLPFDSFSIAWDRRQVVYLAIYFLAATVPFLCSGLLVGSRLIAAGRARGGAHFVYAANLIGSAFGCVASLPALAAFGAEGALVLAALIGTAAGICFVERSQLRAGVHGRILPTALALLVVALLAMLVLPPALLAQRLSPYKTLPVLLQGLDSTHTVHAWDSTARLDVVESSAIHSMPGLSLLSPVGPPPQAGLMLDGDNLAPITGAAPDSEQARQLAANMPNGLVYHLRPGARTLVIEAGTGLDVLLAVAAGAEHVTAVEDNALVIEAVRDTYRAFTGGLYTHPRVDIVNQSGRVFARGVRPGSFDAVTVALTDPHHPVTSGAYSLGENYVYTVEAFGDYLRALDDDGVLVVSRWLQTPPSECGRTFATLAAALAGSGRNPADHLVAFRTMRTITIVASVRPFSAGDVERVRAFLRGRGYDGVYFPGIRPDELNRYNVLPEPAYHNLFVDILNDPVGTYAEYRFDIRPPTDDRPFFFHYFKWRQTPEILATLGQTWQPFGGSGYFVLVALLALVGAAAAVLILGPLLLAADLRRTRPRSGALPSAPPGRVRVSKVRVFAYFACLGIAFLFVEIPLAQRFILVLGHPVVALAVVLFTLLLFSGIGSLTVQRWRLEVALAALVLLVGLYPVVLPLFATLALRLPEWERIALSILVLAPAGYLMGLPFAGGVRVLERHDSSLIPWAWAINGSVSVVSAVLAVLLALSWGFTAVLWLGMLAYAGALAAFLPYAERDTAA